MALDNNFVDKISQEFADSFVVFYFEKRYTETKATLAAVKKMDKDPDKIIKCVADVAMKLFNVSPTHSTFPKKFILEAVAFVKENLSAQSLDSCVEEDRLLLYWCSVARFLASFKVCFNKFDFTDEQINRVWDLAQSLKVDALAYNKCSKGRVREMLKNVQL